MFQAHPDSLPPRPMRVLISYHCSAGLTDHDRRWIGRLGRPWPVRHRELDVPADFALAFFRARGALRAKLRVGFHASPSVHFIVETPQGLRPAFDAFVYDWSPTDHGRWGGWGQA